MRGRGTGVLESRRPAATREASDALRAFVGRMDDVVAVESDPNVVALRAGALLAPLLEHESLLEDRHRRAHEDRYRQHVVHVHPEGRYSVVSLVWKPGQATPIHDHRCWCVVGVWRGVERETQYELVTGRGGQSLLVRGSSRSFPGDVSVLVPPHEDIHKVENDGGGLAISLHVYGADIATLGSSINQVFDQPVVPEAPPEADPVAWRRAAGRA